MADENQTPEGGNEPQLNPIEQKAMEQGWRPLEQWEGPQEDWRDAKSFLDRGELFGKIDAQRGEIKQLRHALNDLRNHNARIAEVEYKRALNTLKAQKREALADGNVDAVIEIDDQIDVVKDAQRAAQAAPVVQPQSDLKPIFQNWVARNPWFEKDRVMQAYANDIGRQYAVDGLSPTEILEKVESEVKKTFPDKFTNPNRAKAPAVEGSTNKGARTSEKEPELTDMERRVMQRLVSSGTMTKEKYLADLKKIKGA